MFFLCHNRKTCLHWSISSKKEESRLICSSLSSPVNYSSLSRPFTWTRRSSIWASTGTDSTGCWKTLSFSCSPGEVLQKPGVPEGSLGREIPAVGLPSVDPCTGPKRPASSAPISVCTSWKSSAISLMSWPGTTSTGRRGRPTSCKPSWWVECVMMNSWWWWCLWLACRYCMHGWLMCRSCFEMALLL